MRSQISRNKLFQPAKRAMKETTRARRQIAELGRSLVSKGPESMCTYLACAMPGVIFSTIEQYQMQEFNPSDQ